MVKNMWSLKGFEGLVKGYIKSPHLLQSHPK
ncbi:MAG: hypothetical protein FD133_917, partial [Erysipelotrichaceae bacterium]